MFAVFALLAVSVPSASRVLAPAPTEPPVPMSDTLADSRPLREAALLHKVPYYTTLSGAVAAAQGIKAYLGGDLEVRALQSYYGSRA